MENSPANGGPILFNRPTVATSSLPRVKQKESGRKEVDVALQIIEFLLNLQVI